jgi:hypothetical protein
MATTINAKQEHLKDIWSNGQMIATPTPVTAAMTGTLNSQRLAEDIQYVSDQNGKVRSIQALYMTEPCEDAGSDTSVLVCDGDAPEASISKTYAPSFKHFGGSFKYNPKAFEADVDGGLGYFNTQIARQMDRARKGAEKYLVAQLLALKGTFAAAVRGTKVANVKDIATFANATDQTLDRFTLGEIQRDARANRYISAPTIIGYGEIEKYITALNSAGVDRFGFNAEKNLMQNQFNFLPTVYADQWDTLPAEKFITYDMGAMPVANPAMFIGDAIFDSVDKKAYTMKDPVSGLIFDIKENVTCVDGSSFETTVSVQARLMTLDLPADLYCATGEAAAAGVNGINAYQINNPV